VQYGSFVVVVSRLRKRLRDECGQRRVRTTLKASSTAVLQSCRTTALQSYSPIALKP
jgi:hypothetical protein